MRGDIQGEFYALPNIRGLTRRSRKDPLVFLMATTPVSVWQHIATANKIKTRVAEGELSESYAHTFGSAITATVIAQ